MGTQNSFDCAKSAAACNWEAAGYEASSSSSTDDESPSVSSAEADIYNSKACHVCVQSMQPSCAVEYCVMGLPDDENEEIESCTSSASSLLAVAKFRVSTAVAAVFVFLALGVAMPARDGISHH